MSQENSSRLEIRADSCVRLRGLNRTCLPSVMNLIAIVRNDNVPLPILVDSSDIVPMLKLKLWKTEKDGKFRGLDAKDLVLWKVAPILPWLVGQLTILY